jgi:diketogulonate reductase-like aldo/keto reductase
MGVNQISEAESVGSALIRLQASIHPAQVLIVASSEPSRIERNAVAFQCRLSDQERDALTMLTTRFIEGGAHDSRL